MNDRRETGFRFFEEVMGRDRAQALRGIADSGKFGSAMADMATEFAFGTVWSRDGLDRRHRSLVVIGVLIAQRQTAELRNHVRIALANGVTVRELEEVLYQSVPYVGFPAAASAATTIIETLREDGLEPLEFTEADN